jgi:hypothetical protein
MARIVGRPVRAGSDGVDGLASDVLALLHSCRIKVHHLSRLLTESRDLSGRGREKRNKKNARHTGTRRL